MSLERVIAWYARNVYGVIEGPGVLPFYCNPARVGRFAVQPSDLASGDEDALFKLFICLSMFQGIRDVAVMKRQRSLSADAVETIASLTVLNLRVRSSTCSLMSHHETLENVCSIHKRGAEVDCDHKPGQSCHVKEAATSFGRMGDMGKLPTSAWFNVWRQSGGLRGLLRDTVRAETSPTARAHLLVERFSRVRRVGEKLATMYVSALSTPSLAPGLTPWHPQIEGNALTVLDTNVVNGINALHGRCAPRTAESRRLWLTKKAQRIDLTQFAPNLPVFSPRIVQQAIYWFFSKSNREAHLTGCGDHGQPCQHCVPHLCPFSRPSQKRTTRTRAALDKASPKPPRPRVALR